MEEKKSGIQSLKKGAHIHLMGICGTAMASLAGLLKDQGFRITGSDQNPYPPMSTQLESLGIEIQKGYSADNLKQRPDFVIVGNVISRSNPEAEELVRQGIPYTSLPQAMGEFIIGDLQSVVVSGTHGKTTTTSMMAWVLDSLGEKPGFLIGGIPKNFSKSFRNPQGRFFVIEGDEYDTAFFDKVPKFVHYRPRHVILTSVEFDHADIYKDLEDVKNAFRRLLQLIPADGNLLWCAHEKNISDLVKEKSLPSYSYGIQVGDYQSKVLSVSEKGTEFQLSFQGQLLTNCFLPMSGNYNILNATAVLAMVHRWGMDVSRASQSLASFQGVKRRQEILGEPQGILVIEDFAHHPTAVRETLQGIRARYPTRKVFAVFEPRSATSRRKVFQKDYVQAFMGADRVIIAQAFDQSKIDQSERFSVDDLVQDIQKQNKPAATFETADQIVTNLVKESHAGDLILIMSNGGFDGIYQKLLTSLASYSK